MTEDPVGTPRPPPSRKRAGAGDSEPIARQRVPAGTLQRSCARLTETLRATFGADGSTALLARSLALAEPDHPALAAMRRRDGREIVLDGVAAAVDRHGQAAVEEAVDALMTALEMVLGRLVGEDMAMRIIYAGATPDGRRGSR
jgi:hypothetical protein